MLLLKRKNIFIYVLIFAIITSIINGVTLSAATNDESYAGNQLQQLGVLTGYSDGSLGLDRNITRAEVATMMVRIQGYGSRTVPGETKKFSDITTGHWAYNHVQNAYRLNMIQGYPNQSFQPEANIRYQEVVAIMVNTLGYKEQLVGEWPMNYINKAKEIGVIPANSQTDPAHIVTRGEMALIVWDTLLVKTTN
jgi:hypothetical protein